MRLVMDIVVFILNKVVVSGLVIGSIYALGAVGVTLIAGILRFSHFAHGDVMTMGAFISFVLAGLFAGLGLGWLIASGIVVVPVAMLLAAIIVYGFDLAFYRPLRRRGSAADHAAHRLDRRDDDAAGPAAPVCGHGDANLLRERAQDHLSASI